VINKNDRGLSIQRPYLDGADIVVIGNGIAGLTAALEARSLAPDKRIVIITDQIHPTINTPALKQFAIGKLTREQLLAYPAGTERTERIHIVPARVEEIHAQSKYVTLAGGRGFGYSSLLIATGSAPTGLAEDLPGRNFDGVMTLHRLQDYLNLRRHLAEVSEAVVIGGGAHAIETVMGLLHWGIHVNWLIRSKTFMSNALDATASQMVLARLQRAGVSILTETEILGVVGRVGGVVGVITNHQEMIPCQLVLFCTGTQPVMDLAKRCTLPMRHKRGILVDDQLHTSVRDIYAAGDVAALKNPLTGAYETRAQWYAAVSQGRTVAAVMTGHEELASEPFGVQWHATHLGELSMLTVGSPLVQHERITTLTDTGQGGYRRMTIVDDRLVGYLSLGPRQPDSLAIKRIIDEGHSIRSITKPLLKGTFDARKYLSQQHTRAAQGMLNTRALPALPGVISGSGNSAQRQPIRIAGESSRPTRVLPPPQPAYVQTDPLPPHERHTDELQRQSFRQTGPIQRNMVARPAPEFVEEELGTFTGHLPNFGGNVIESAPPQQQNGRMPSGQLWSYANEAIPVESFQSQRRRPSGSLWSYNDSGNLRKGR
jgi:NAD(P)H-nitrite reductase large subunit